MITKSEERLHSDEFIKIISTLNRAIASSSQVEKNSALEDLKQKSIDQIDYLETKIAQNKRKNEELEELNTSFNKVKSDLRDIRNKQILLHLLLQKGDETTQDGMIDVIQKYEEQISKLISLERPDLLEIALSRTDNIGVRLMDIKIQRIEETIYALRKRILEIEKNEEYAPAVNEEFGGNCRLMKTYERLLEENTILKESEVSAASDVLSRRRSVTSLSPSSTRDLVMFLQKEFEIHVKILRILNPDFNEGILNDFCEISDDPHLLDLFDDPEEDVIKNQKAESYESKILTEQIKQTPLPEIQDSQGNPRAVKLYTLTKNGIYQIRELNDRISMINVENQKVAAKLQETTEELKKVKLEYASRFEPFTSLLKAYTNLKQNIMRNKSVLRTLSVFDSSMALDCQEFRDLLNHKFPQKPNRAKSLGNKYTDKETKDQSEYFKSTPRLRRLTLEDLMHDISKDDNFIRFHMTSLIAECSAPIFDCEPVRYTNLWNTLCSNIRQLLTDQLNRYQRYINDEILRVSKVSGRLLRKERADTETFTDIYVHVDNEVQVDMITPPNTKRQQKSPQKKPRKK